jgi:L-iditol 2-dehydrogenase
MKAAVIYQVGDIRMAEVDIPKLKSDEVLIRIHACGVCGTDHSLFVEPYPANYPVIIGHEFSGTVEAVGNDIKNIQVGDRVTADPNRVCHQCNYCRMGSEHLCENAQSMGVHKAIDLISSGVIRVNNLISHRNALKDYLDVFKIWGNKDTHKLMVLTN